MLFDLNVTRDIRPLLTGRHAIKRLKDFVDKNIWVVPSRFPFITYFYFIKTLLHLFSFSTTLTQQSRKRVQNTWDLQSCDTKTARENCQHNIYTFSLNIVKYKIVLMWTFKYSTHCFRHASLHYNALLSEAGAVPMRAFRQKNSHASATFCHLLLRNTHLF